MAETRSEGTGKIYLVGAGPGAPGLITVRGIECLERADVVLYDELVHPQLLEHAPEGAELTGLGQLGAAKNRRPRAIGDRLAQWARQGKTVVRLKGGDPVVFARIEEEAELLVRERIPFEIIPGVTAALGAGAFAGLPLTCRDVAAGVALIAGQDGSAESAAALDCSALASFPGTLVFYMGVQTARQWAEALQRAGKPPETPVAIVAKCTCPDQVTVRSTLAELARGGEVGGPTPAVIVVGEAAAPERSLSWLENRPLHGLRVMVTRARHQSGSLVDRLADLGAEVLVQPAIEITEPPDWSPVDRALDRLAEFDWLVFSSANGVRRLVDRVLATGRDLRALGGVKLAAIGPGTAAALAEFYLRCDLQAAEFRAEALAAALAAGAAGQRFLLARASRGREVLAEQLQAAGGQVEQVVVYSSVDVAAPEEAPARLLRDGRVDWITVTSSAIARSLAALFGEDLRKSRLASISPVTSATLAELGWTPAVEASRYTMDGVVEAIVRAASESRRSVDR